METSDASFDNVHQTTILKSVKNLGEKPATTVRIFERNNFYYIFEEDGQLAAKLIYGAVTAMKQMGKNEPKNFAVINRSNFEVFLRHVLLVKHYRVEVYKFSAGGGGHPPHYALEVRCSPGNISSLEHLLYGEADQIKETNYLVGVKLCPSQQPGGQFKLGVAAVDTSLKLISVCEIEDCDMFSNLETILVQLSPREAILPQSENATIKKIQQMVERNKILVTSINTKEFSKIGESDIDRIVNNKSNKGCVKDLEMAGGALRAVMTYLGVMAETGDSAKFRLEEFKHSEFMRIDARTVTGLNLLDIPGQPTSSLYKILNRTRTPGGNRLLQSWIKQPLRDVDKINERLDLVEIFSVSTEMRQMMYENHLRRMPDFQRFASKFQAQRATLQDIYKVYVALGKLGTLKTCLESYDGDNKVILQENFVTDITENLTEFEKFCQMVQTTLDIDQIETSGQFLIKPEFDEQLGELRQQLDDLEEKLRRCLSGCASELCLEAGKTLKMEYSGQHGYFFRVTMKDEKNLRGNKSFNIIDSSKGGVKFRNNKMEALNDQHAAITKDYERYQASIVLEMVGICASYADQMNHLGLVISRLDVVVGLAVAAVTAPTPYCRPRLVKDGTGRQMRFSQLRHPIVEVQDGVNYIPNDVQFDSDKSVFHIVTGPNMGGKSTYIRSVGLATIMAQMGSFVPADTAEMSLTDAVMVRIGASDCQVKGISTFMAEMLETSAILQSATSNSLVLIDELGRGTSTYDGFGLAWSVSEHIAATIRCFSLFTTHYTELTGLADTVPGVENYHVSAVADNNRLTLLYEVKPGVCDKSFGLHVAKLADFPDSVVEEAGDRVAKLEDAGKIQDMAEKEKRKVTEEGENILKDFFEKVKDLDTSDDAGLVEKFEKLKQDIVISSNPYIQGIVTAATS